MILLPLFLAAAAAAPAQNFAVPAEFGAAVQASRALEAGAPRAAAPSAPASAAAPINTGFSALGAAGKSGKVDGPGPFGVGDGTYQVIQNDPYQMVFDMSTGYVQGRFTMKRDPATGKDTLGFSGRSKDGPLSGWTQGSGSFAGQISYASGSDSGTIFWELDGKKVTDSFKGGRSGRTMTITLKGNSHTFTQN
jgi:hypothetical protein